FAD
ncbi:MOSC domain protein, partial [Vibrio parahaemolyticus EKP-028]